MGLKLIANTIGMLIAGKTLFILKEGLGFTTEQIGAQAKEHKPLTTKSAHILTLVIQLK